MDLRDRPVLEVLRRDAPAVPADVDGGGTPAALRTGGERIRCIRAADGAGRHAARLDPRGAAAPAIPARAEPGTPSILRLHGGPSTNAAHAVRRPRRASLAAALALAALLPHAPALAHNGAFAVARPQASIQVDGDLADWPADLPSQPIGMVGYGDLPDGPADFSGTLRALWSPETDRLWLAVEVLDQDPLTDLPAPAYWEDVDGCNVYFDLLHDRSASSAIQLHTYGYSQGEAFEAGAVSWRHAWTGTGHVWEWGVDLGAWLPAGTGLLPACIGFDVAVGDKDADGSFSWLAWGPGAYKTDNARRLGDLWLLREDEGVGRLEGGFGAAGALAQPPLLTFERADGWCRLRAGRDGRFAFDLPEGRWSVTVGPSSGEAAGAGFRIQSGATVELDLEPPVDRSRRQALGPGRLEELQLRSGSSPRVAEIVGSREPVPALGLAVDEDGALWVAGPAELQRVDGQRRLRLGVADGLPGPPTAIRAASGGGLWVGFAGRLGRLRDRELELWGAAEGLLGETVVALLEDRSGRLWIGTDGGLNRLDGDGLESWTAADGLRGDRVTCLLEDRRGRIWVGTANAGLHLVEGDRIRPLAEIRADGRSRSGITALLEGRDGAVWAGTWSGGLLRVDGEEVRVYDRPEGLRHEGVSALALDAAGRVWVGHGRSSSGWTGLSIGGEEGFRSVATAGLASLDVRALEADSAGQVWLGGPGGLLRCSADLDDGGEPPAFETGGVSVFARDGAGRAWAAGTSGLWRDLDGSPELVLPLDMGFSEYFDLALSGDTAWVAAPLLGLRRLEPGRPPRKIGAAQGLVTDAVHSVLPLGGGSLWAGTQLGLCRLDADGGRPWLAEHGLASGSVNALLLAGDTLWAGAAQGLSRLTADGAVRSWFPAAGLPGDQLGCLLRDRRGRLWIGGSRGLGWLEGERLVRPPDEAGWPRNVQVLCLLEDGEGRIWAGTAGQGLFVGDDERVQQWLPEDGLPDRTVNALLDNGDGSFWVGTPRGARRWSPAAPPPGLRLDDVVLNGRLGPVESVSATTRDRLLAVEFHGSSLRSRPGGLLYRWRLLPGRPDWSTTRDERIELGALPLGSHRLELQACDQDLRLSAVRALAVEVRPDWERLALLASGALVTLALLWLLAAAVGRDFRLRRQRETLEKRVAERTAELSAANERLQEEIREREAGEVRERALQEKVEAEQRLAAVGQLAAGVAHDFNNLLTGVMGHAEMIRLQTAETDTRASAEVIHQQGRRAARLIRQILDFGRRSPGRRVPLDAGRLLEETVALLRRTMPETLELRLAAGTRCWTLGDAAQLQQVLANLALNARDAMPAGGVLGFSVVRLRADECGPPVEVPASGDWLRLVVEDDGEGMPPDVLARIFEPFFTTKDVGKGSGLGLSQVYGIVRQHGGFVEARSEPGQGARFEIWLPACDEEPGRGSEAEGLPAGGGETVLLVEDEPTVRQVTSRLLERLGYVALHAADGLEALAILEGNAAVDVVLSDVVMPRMGGADLAKELARRRPDLPVVLMSGYPLRGDRVDGAAPAIRLEKPVDLAGLGRAIREALDGAAGD